MTRLLTAILVVALAVPAPVLAAGLTPGTPDAGPGRQQNDEDRDEIELGREADQAIEAQYGFYDDAALQEYVDGLGRSLASLSERPQLPWTFRILDSPVVNAFALPGGFVYVTRGLLAYTNSEAELAGVLGHEIGHVTGRHSRGRSRASTWLSIGLLAGSLLSGTVRDIVNTGLPQQVSGLFLLKYSRDQELDADERGIGYATAAGYDPRGIGGFFETLQNLEEQSDRKKVPGWVSTHPQVDDRIERSEQTAAEAVARYGLRPDELFVGHREMLQAVDDVVFGENPREGYLAGDDFLHPDLRFALTFPSGWTVGNARDSVTVVSPRESAYLQLTLSAAPGDGDTERVVRRYLSDLNARVADIGARNDNELEAIEAVFRVNGGRGSYAVLGHWVLYGERMYRILGVTSSSAWRDHADTLVASVRSFRELTDPDSLAAEPARLSIVEVGQRQQLRGVLEAYSEISVGAQTVAILNHRGLDDLIPAGSLIKLIFGGPQKP